MRIALDTNVLAYAEGVDDLARQNQAKDVLKRLRKDDLVISVQILGELYNVLVRKGRTRESAKAAVQFWCGPIEVVETGRALMTAAIELASQHHLRIWDGLILAAAAESGCSLLISEDFQDGFAWNGVTVANPFATPLHPLLAAALQVP